MKTTAVLVGFVQEPIQIWSQICGLAKWTFKLISPTKLASHFHGVARVLGDKRCESEASEVLLHLADISNLLHLIKQCWINTLQGPLQVMPAPAEGWEAFFGWTKLAPSKKQNKTLPFPSICSSQHGKRLPSHTGTDTL